MKEQQLIELVTKAQNGDKCALNDLVAQCYDDIYYYVLKTVKDQDLAADVTQDSFLEIMTTIDKLRDPKAFNIWARRVAYHKCTHHFRKTKEILVDETEDGESIFDNIADESEYSLPEKVLEDKEFCSTIMDMINGLPSEQTNALLLFYYENLDVKQIAEIQNAAEGTVKSRLNYARKALKSKIEEYEKKTQTKLHSVAILPLLLRFVFGNEKESMPKIAIPATMTAGAVVSGGAASSALGTSVAGAIGKATGGALFAKIVASVAAVAVVTGGSIFAVHKLGNDENAQGSENDLPAVNIIDQSETQSVDINTDSTESSYSNQASTENVTSADDTSSEISQEEVQTESIDELFGKWELANSAENTVSAAAEIPQGFMINSEGITINGITYKARVGNRNFIFEDAEKPLKDIDLYYEIYNENEYIICMSQGSSRYYFFRPDEYEAVELTEENVFDYIQSTEELHERFDNNYSIYGIVDFTDNAAFPSWFVIDSEYSVVTKAITINADGSYVLGDIISETPSEGSFAFEKFPNYSRGVGRTNNEYDLQDQETLNGEFACTKLTNIKSVQGVVYIHKSNELCRHDYESVITQPDCLNGGNTQIICKLCGENKIVDETAPLGHDYSHWEVIAEANCQVSGSQTHKCKLCGLEETEEIPVADHDFGEWTVVSVANCNTQGEQTRVCNACNYQATETTPALGHDYGDGVVIKEATTCADMGLKRFSCKNCGHSYDKEVKGEHVFGEREIDFVGNARYTCQGCYFRYYDFWENDESRFSDKDPNAALRTDKTNFKESQYTGMLADWSDDWIEYMNLTKLSIQDYSYRSTQPGEDISIWDIMDVVSEDKDANQVLAEYNGPFRTEFQRCFGWLPAEAVLDTIEYPEGDVIVVNIDGKEQCDAYRSQAPNIPSSKKQEVVEDMAAYLVHNSAFDGMDVYNAAANMGDGIKNNVFYDYTFRYYSAFDCVAAGIGVCQGQSELYQVMCEYAGINSQIVIGTLRGVGHSWNSITFSDGTVRYIDPTNLYADYLYLVTDEYLRRTHSW